MSNDISTDEKINDLISSSSLQLRSKKNDDMSAILTKTIQELHSETPKFVIAKRLIHEVLKMHYIVSEERLPQFIFNDSQGILSYRSLPLNYEIDVSMNKNTKMNTFLFNFVNLHNENSVAIVFSLHDIDCFLSNTGESMLFREEKFTDIHKRIGDFLKGKNTFQKNPPPGDLKAPVTLPDWF